MMRIWGGRGRKIKNINVPSAFLGFASYRKPRDLFLFKLGRDIRKNTSTGAAQGSIFPFEGDRIARLEGGFHWIDCVIVWAPVEG